MRVRKKLRQQYGYPLSVGHAGGKKKVKRWGIQAVHTLPTGFSRSLTTAPDACSVSSSGGSDDDGDDVASDAVESSSSSDLASSQSFRKCDVSFGNACFATGTVGFMLASCIVNAIGLDSDLKPKYLGKHFKHQVDGSSRVVTDSLTAIVTGKSDKDIGSAAGMESCSCGIVTTGIEANHSLSDSQAYCHPVITLHDGMKVEERAIQKSNISHTLENLNQRSDSRSMQPLVDAHCHLQLDPLYRHSDDAIALAQSHGVTHIVVCGTQPGDDWYRIERLYRLYPSTIG